MFTKFKVIDDFLKLEHFNFLINLKLDQIKERRLKFITTPTLKTVKLKNLV